jgi:uncharacterized membrane protein YfcA
MSDYFWLCLAAAAAGGVNALAGGGTLLTFPTLIGSLGSNPLFARDAERLANGTSTVALVPASLGSAWGFRRELFELRRLLVWLLPPSLVGGVIGSLLVTRLPSEIFSTLVPWLILGQCSSSCNHCWCPRRSRLSRPIFPPPPRPAAWRRSRRSAWPGWSRYSF